MINFKADPDEKHLENEVCVSATTAAFVNLKYRRLKFLPVLLRALGERIYSEKLYEKMLKMFKVCLKGCRVLEETEQDQEIQQSLADIAKQNIENDFLGY